MATYHTISIDIQQPPAAVTRSAGQQTVTKPAALIVDSDVGKNQVHAALKRLINDVETGAWPPAATS